MVSVADEFDHGNEIACRTCFLHQGPSPYLATDADESVCTDPMHCPVDLAAYLEFKSLLGHFVEALDDAEPLCRSISRRDMRNAMAVVMAQWLELQFGRTCHVAFVFLLDALAGRPRNL